jgi:hypothetical protein
MKRAPHDPAAHRTTAQQNTFAHAIGTDLSDFRERR